MLPSCGLLVKITAGNSEFGASFTGAAPVGRAGKAGELVSRNEAEAACEQR